MTGASDTPSVLVIMATYNGEKYVSEQIESILSQENVSTRLYITDDCSTDRTYEICTKYASENDNVVVHRNNQNKRVARNFMNVLYETDIAQFDYYAFSDQDDVWLPDKLAHAIAKLDKCSSDAALYYSDVTNVDANLENGRGEYYPFAPYVLSLKLLLTVNWASGCTMVFNRSFAEVITSYVPQTWPRLHDGWAHLVALAHGWTVPDLEHAYILRRITGDNQVGTRGFGLLGARRVMAGFRSVFESRDRCFSTTTVEYLLDGYRETLPEESVRTLESFLQLNKSFTGRIRLALDRGYRGPYPIENALYKIKMLMGMY